MYKYLLYLLLYSTQPFSVLTASLDDILSHYIVLQNCDNQISVTENCLDFQQFVNISSLRLHLNIKGDIYRLFLDAYDHSIFAKDIRITTDDNGTTTNFTNTNFMNLPVYEGLDANGTYACAYVLNDSFTGFLMLSNGSSIYIESFNQLNPTSSTGNYKSVAYEISDVRSKRCSLSNSSSCHENSFTGSLGCKRENRRKISCFLKAIKEDINPRFHFFSNIGKSEKTRGNAQLFRMKNFTCSLSLTIDSSFYAHYHYNMENTLVELLLVLKHVNQILRSTDFDGDGHQDGLTFRIRSITVGQDTSFDNETSETDKTVTNLVEDFRMVPQDDCISLMLVSLQTDPDLLTVAYGGGICRNNEMELEPARNTAIVNNIDDSGTARPLFVTAWAVTMAIGQVMGSAERTCNTKDLYPSDDWTAFFSECRRDNIARILMKQGSCLKLPTERDVEIYHELQPEQPNNLSACGNGDVDTGEECDCGSADQCKVKSSCCTPPGSKGECRYNRAKGYECDWPEICCTQDCKIVPKTWNQFCGSGEPTCSPDEAYCNGDGSHCPIPRSALSLKDGKRCGPSTLKQAGAATCNAGHCNSSVCRDAGLEDCMCSVTSRQECRVCCKKREVGKAANERLELCVPAEYFGVTSKNERFFYRYRGTPCNEIRFGHCDGYGNCVMYQNFGVSAATTIRINHNARIIMVLLLLKFYSCRSILIISGNFC